METRSRGFLAHLYDNPSVPRDAEVGRYVTELHEYLWRFVRAEMPGASGNLGQFLDDAVSRAEQRNWASGNIRNAGEGRS